MGTTVDFYGIAYYDSTGYATHVLIELDQYLPYHCGRHSGNVRTAAFSVPVRNGEAILPCPGAERVFRITVQPVIAHTSGEKRNLGSPFVATAPGGVFYDWAILRTLGELIERTILEEALLSTSAGGVKLPENLYFDEKVQSKANGIHQFEMMFIGFEYHDTLIEGGVQESAEGATKTYADQVDITIDGVQNGVNGRWSYTVEDEDNDHVFDLAVPKLQDVTRVEFQPRSGKKLHGNLVVMVPTSGMYVSRMVADSLFTDGQVINRTYYCVEKTPAGTTNPFQSSTLIPTMGRSRSVTKRGAQAKA